MTVLEAGSRPLVHAVGTTVADWICSLHDAAGVDLQVGVAVEAFEGDTGVRAVRTQDGGHHRADLVIMAIGIELRLDAAGSAGCTIDSGVVVDDRSRTSVDGVLAVGDIARFPCRFAGSTADGFPTPYRCEHYNVALGHGAAAARTILGEDTSYDDLPTYWTDQYELTVNGCGPTELADEVLLRGHPDDHDFVAAYLRNGRLIAGLACGQRREYRSLRRLLQRGVPVTSADLTDPDVTFADLDCRSPTE